MIGNDVIDLVQSRKESNWQRSGFIDKIFTLGEQLLISKASDPEIMVWILWSMKEAAYKIYNRKTKLREYIPKKLTCCIEFHQRDFISGTVICSGNVYYTKTIVLKDTIHTVAVSSFEDLSKVVEIEKKSVIKDINGIPYLNTPLRNTFQDVSVSHHGRFEKVVTISI